MTNKLDKDLKSWLDKLVKTEPDQLLPVIITLKPGANASALRAKGLHIAQQFPFISAVSGEMTARDALAVAALDDVVKIEHDGEMHALG